MTRLHRNASDCRQCGRPRSEHDHGGIECPDGGCASWHAEESRAAWLDVLHQQNREVIRDAVSAPNPLDEPAAPFYPEPGPRAVWGMHTHNPGAMVGNLVAWIVTCGRHGRLPLYRDEVTR